MLIHTDIIRTKNFILWSFFVFEIRCFCETACLEKSFAKLGYWGLMPKIGFKKEGKVLASLQRAEGKCMHPVVFKKTRNYLMF